MEELVDRLGVGVCVARYLVQVVETPVYARWLLLVLDETLVRKPTKRRRKGYAPGGSQRHEA